VGSIRKAQIKAVKPLSKYLPKELNTIGDMIRKRRVELGMTQKALADLFGVSLRCLQTWECSGKIPFASRWPKIIDFLGYHPLEILFSQPTFGELVMVKRLSFGLSQEAAAKLIGINPVTLQRIEEGLLKRGMNRETKQLVDCFLET
jgi:transcriptional regulator with XRE-family HTH domain